MEPRSAFYWRENLLGNGAQLEDGGRRNESEVDKLRRRAIEFAESGWTQREIAAELVISRRYVRALLAGHTFPGRGPLRPTFRKESVAHLAGPVKRLRAEGKSFDEIQAELNISRDKVRRALRT
jgi:DNA-binding CsgD family transcriptional regulator